MIRLFLFVVSFTLSLANLALSDTSDWPQFRGPNGTGMNADGQKVPEKWSVANNTKWRIDLPGPGHSSPIIVNGHLYLTCWTGKDIDPTTPGDRTPLKFHLLCVDRKDGKIVWDQKITPDLPEGAFLGDKVFGGFTSHTPVSDGQNIFAFFGSTGVIAFDLTGTQLWQTPVGKGLDPSGHTSAASPILFDNLVIVTASIEDRSVVALDKETGQVVWKQQSEDFHDTYGTPVLVQSKGRTDLALSVPNKIVCLDPSTGERLWSSVGSQDNIATSSLIAHDGVVYVIGGRGGGTLAVRTGGKGDVSETNTLWESGRSGKVTTPLLHGGRLYWIHNNTAYCLDAKTGKGLYRSRLSPSKASNTRSRDPNQRRVTITEDFASPVIAGTTMYHLRGDGEMMAIQLGDELVELGTTIFDGGGEFYATPAISQGQLFVRSTKHLYCISHKD